MCTECHKTFSATKGTALYRLRTPAETVSLVVWRARVQRPGEYAVRVRSNTGVTQGKLVNITQTGG